MYALSLQSLSDTIDVCLLQENFTNQLYISDFQLEYIYFTHQGAAKFLVKTSFPSLPPQSNFDEELTICFWGPSAFNVKSNFRDFRPRMEWMMFCIMLRFRVDNSSFRVEVNIPRDEIMVWNINMNVECYCYRTGHNECYGG